MQGSILEMDDSNLPHLPESALQGYGETLGNDEVEADTASTSNLNSSDDELAQSIQQKLTEAFKEEQASKNYNTQAETATQNVSYNAEEVCNKLFTPFKANGREIQIRDVDEAISLMQMGANYTKKMHALKPHLNLMRLLESHNLLNEDKINYLIDLAQNKQEAVAKLVKDSKVDTYNINDEDIENYKPTPRSISDKDIELSDTLSDLASSPKYQTLIDEVANKWDAQSRNYVTTNPQILKLINEQMEAGIYDVIHTEIERQRMFGKFENTPYLEAYKVVGDSLHEQGVFARMAQQNGSNGAVASQPAPSVVDKRKAASTTRTSPSVNTSREDFSPLALSDEEFERILQNRR